MKKLSFSLLLFAVFCFVGCGNNQSKKAEAAVNCEASMSCCEEGGHGTKAASDCGGGECADKGTATHDACGGDGDCCADKDAAKTKGGEGDCCTGK